MKNIDPNHAIPPQPPTGAHGMRTRTSIVLCTALLLTSVAIATLTINLLKNQHLILEDAIRESRAQAMGLLANRVEQTMQDDVRTPFFALKNIPPAAVDGALLSHNEDQYPEVEHV